MLNIQDPWLTPYKEYLQQRLDHVKRCQARLTDNGKMPLSDFANGHRYFGLHVEADSVSARRRRACNVEADVSERRNSHWVFREWLPNADEVFLVGDFNDWQPTADWQAHRIGDNGVWQLTVPKERMHHGQHYKMLVRWDGGEGLRIPAWCRRVVQDPTTLQFSAQVWERQPYQWQNVSPVNPPSPTTHHQSPLLIYEAHVGMAQEEPRVGTYTEFRDNVLPRIARAGYNAVQLMAIQEHPYYGSFGYHVSSLFAPSSRFGTPEELKSLIDTAHGMGLRVIIDIVHSHAVKNVEEGLGLLAGDSTQYFHAGGRGHHPAWDSLCYDYGKPEVMHLLLSNCKYWLEEFRFDGFRFDGVTSMLYLSHGLGEAFTSYDDYFSPNADLDAWAYLALANTLMHQVSPQAVSIAEEVSGMPMLTVPADEGGAGFDYRMAMNIPDYWIRLLKEQTDEQWSMGEMFHQLTNHRMEERTVSYVESHDQALVGDKTLIHRLADADLYWHFRKDDRTMAVDRAIALHKMIRLATLTTINGAYLCFMGNEFGHPEWIDFPREGNQWSHHYARRQWHLADDDTLCYNYLLLFDHDMIALAHSGAGIFGNYPQPVCCNDGDKVMAFMRGEWLFVFNFSAQQSYTDYGISVPPGCYQAVLDTDDALYGGQQRNKKNMRHFTMPRRQTDGSQKIDEIKLYLPARTAMVLKRTDK